MLANFLRHYRFSISLIALLLLPLVSRAARQVTLAWDPSPDSSVIGYRIHYGTSPGQYQSVLDVGPLTTITVTTLAAGTEYYFAVTAYSSSRIESSPSNEISYQTPPPVPPAVQITSPNTGAQVNGPISLNVEAQATDPDGLLARVELYNGSNKVSEAVAPPYQAVINNLPAGQYSLSAVAVDQSGARWPSSPVAIEVVQLKAGQTKMQANGSFEITVSGAIGSTNRVWVSADLVHWELLQTVENTDGNFTIVDPGAAGASQRFYKVSSP